MSYIRSIQAEFFEFGICSIQPPAEWQPPTSFHWRSAQQEQWKEEAEQQQAEQQEHEQEQQEEEQEEPAASKAAAVTAGGAAVETTTTKKGPPSAEKKGAKKGAAAEGGAGSEWEPITDHSDFYARLQTVKQRKSSPGQPHCTPFSCSFVPRYAKYTIAQLRSLDSALREEVWPELGGGKLPDKGQVERWFWEGLASEAEARILYSSDLEGTAFPESGTYGEHAWSLARLANHERSLLRFVEYSIPGVNAPMLYFGMLFSMFCWHVEDNYMYSVSYLHEGAPKTWYGVSPANAVEL